MKRIFTHIIVVAVMVAFSVPTLVFAGSGFDSNYDRDYDWEYKFDHWKDRELKKFHFKEKKKDFIAHKERRQIENQFDRYYGFFAGLPASFTGETRVIGHNVARRYTSDFCLVNPAICFHKEEEIQERTFGW